MTYSNVRVTSCAIRNIRIEQARYRRIHDEQLWMPTQRTTK